VDARRSQYGWFVLSGSQNLLLMERVSESLAGRAAILRLLSLSRREVLGQPKGRLPRQRGNAAAKSFPFSPEQFWQFALRGSNPELVALRPR
jgi:predicted AAA+ superfamily ATPase